MEVISKGAKGLGIDSDPFQLSLIVSNGLVRNVSLPNGQPWTLGNYTIEEYKLEESEHLEFVCLILKRWKRMQMKRYALCTVITLYSKIHFIHMI